MIYYHYGNLKDATITAGDITEKAQYPITNINYLNKNLYTHIDDSGSETIPGDGAVTIDLMKVDFGSATNVSSCVLELDAFRIQMSITSGAISEMDTYLYYSDDAITYTTTGAFNPIAIASASYDGTQTEIITNTITEISHRYWKIALAITGTNSVLTWCIDGKINNIYIGDYISLPSPELVPFGFNHKAKFSQAYGGSIFGVETQGQREKWGFNFTNMTEADKTNWKAFDLVNKKGVVPCYMESVEGTTQLIDPYFVRVYGGENLKQSAFELYEMTNNVEEEL